MTTRDEIKYCVRCGSLLQREVRFGRIRPVCQECGWIYFSDPKVAAAVLIESDGRVLLVRRINEPFKGLWTLPAGFVDADEDPAEAASRECFEETGLKVIIKDVLDVVAGTEHERGANFIIVYRAEITGGNLSPGDDADAVQWFSRQELPPLAFEATDKVLHAKM